MGKDELTPLDNKLEAPKQRGRSSMSRLFAPSVALSTIATAVTIISSIVFSIFFYRGLNGFSKQVNAFVSVGDFGSLMLQVLIIVPVIAFVCYLLVVRLAAAKAISGGLRFCGSPCFLMLASLGSQGFLIIWVLILCFVSAITLVYFIFIGSMLSFCALIDQQCFDFRVLIPAIVKRFSKSKLDMTMCAEKKVLLCSQENNQIWSFIIAFLACIVTFTGALLLQNCVVYGLGKKQRSRELKSNKESYEMTEK